MGPGLLATALVGWGSFYFFFDFPKGTHGFGWEDAVRLAVLLTVALLISFLLNRRRRAVERLRVATVTLDFRVVERTRELEASNRLVRGERAGVRNFWLRKVLTDCAICLLDHQGRDRAMELRGRANPGVQRGGGF